MCLELPAYTALDVDQRNIYALKLDGRFLVEGPPGTGKSTLLAASVAGQRHGAPSVEQQRAAGSRSSIGKGTVRTRAQAAEMGGAGSHL